MKINIFEGKTRFLIIMSIFIVTFLFTFYQNSEIVSASEPVSPMLLNSSPRDSAVFLQWNADPGVTDHLIEYRQSSSNNWNVFTHPINPAPGITVTNLINDVNYDFRVSTISNEGQSVPTTISNVTPIAGAIQISNNQIISTGQSNAMGTNAFPAISTSQPYSNLMLDALGSSFIPLVEPITGGMSFTGETMSSALANMISHLTSSTIPTYSSIVSLNAVAGVPYTSLKQGTPIYNHALTDVSNAKSISLANNKTLIVPAITVVHGESDEMQNTTASQYESNLLEWQQDYQTDIQALTGQTEPVPFLIDQMSSWTVFGSSIPRVALGQYEAIKNNPDKIIMVTPRYIFDSIDVISHMTNYSQRRLGEYYAKVYKKVVIDKEEWLPVMPTSITLHNNIILATFHVPVPPLAFDTTAVLLKENYGFEYTDSSNSASITSVQIINSVSVKITLSNAPTGSNPRLRYAYTGNLGSYAGRNIPGSARGNLRDSDTTEALYQDSTTPTSMGNYLRNWSVTFDEPITVIPSYTPVAPTSVSAVAGSAGRAVISFIPPTNQDVNPISSYLVTSQPGNITATGTSSPITVTGLTNNTTYTFTVVAINNVGQSPSSESSNPITLHWPTITKIRIFPTRITPVGSGLKPIDITNYEKPVIIHTLEIKEGGEIKGEFKAKGEITKE